MITKALVMAMFESSLLCESGFAVTDGWQHIVTEYVDSETKSVFTALRDEFLSGAPSFKPFENSASLKDDLVIACHFAELATYTTQYDIFWHDMAVAYILKKKLSTTTPSEADVRLGSYFLSFGDVAPELSLRTEIESWSKAENWKFPEQSTGGTFPEDWWGTFTVDSHEIQFPRTMLPILKTSLEVGSLETFIPKTIFKWSTFQQVVDQVFT